MLLFGPAVVLSAFLLFLIQPLVGKQVLPLFGGSAAVWGTCLLFFQCVLLAGYLYAHSLAKWLKPRQQALLHGAAIAACLLAPRLPMEPGGSAWHVITSLARNIGLPYLLLSATSPLLQHWYSMLHPKGRPYRLSAWSNAACAAALLSFPFFWEPRFDLRQLDRGWTVAFAVEAALLVLAAATILHRNPAEDIHGPRLTTEARTQVRWLGWPALASAFLLATSTHLCQVVAPAPLLWVAPLLVYLLSFVAVFERDWYRRRRGAAMALAGLLAMAGSMLYLDLQAALFWKVGLYCGGLFLVCVFCHGEVASLKPEPARLTSFWTHVAAGGALGSLAVGFVSPLLLRGYFELPLLIAAAGALCVWRVRGISRFATQGAAMAAVLAATPAIAFVSDFGSGLVDAGRNFYGSLRVVDQRGVRKMLHGMVVHGSEFLSGPHAGKPTAYYGPESGAALVLARPGPARQVAVIGLGAGTLAYYGRKGDNFCFYEINPLVIEMAWNNFGYLHRSAADVEVVEGDARLRLAAEGQRMFDVLVVDAFAGDSIPVHLLTREAFALYLSHLRPGGVLALHISNQYLNLEPEVRALASDAGWNCVRVVSPAKREDGVLAATWMLLEGRQWGGPVRVRFPLWTDQRNSVMEVLR